MVAADLLVAWFDIALDHQTLDKLMEFRINIAAVQNFLGDTNLLIVLLVGVGVVGIHDHCRVLEIFFLIFFKKKTKILIMIVWHCLTMFIDRTTQNCMCERISICLHLPASVDETMRSLSCNNRIYHNTEITAGRIFHSGRDIHTADSQTMLLILNRTCTYCNVGKDVGEITVVLRIEHLICAGKSTFLDCMNMHFADSNQSCEHVRSFLRVRLMDHTLVSLTGSTRFIGVNTWNDQNFVFDLFLDLAETQKIVTDSIFIVSRAWTDDCEKFI